ncbi:hypothetical protein QBC46DRAFT_457699 [Diplogelasinospora grovesii]|uniref:Prolyl 4-hydroxylase alpha subunit domain-containing protein n=1 Tax=Diplogelasinospora grovesii TaxID=303347 RepID=A0AAN6S6Y2_9PEZI|nr:hypothetical protein QBC46DRAFT_457699 [Diplogelasinospora grovesii]
MAGLFSKVLGKTPKQIPKGSPKAAPKKNADDAVSRPGYNPNVAIKTNYTSRPVTIPDGFLVDRPADAAASVTVTRINWKTTVLPENKNKYAVILDGVISPSECQELIRLAELSVPGEAVHHVSVEGAGGTTAGNGEADGGEEKSESKRDPWQPALVNIGGSYEAFSPEYRNSDRIIWDCQTIVGRLWDRCVQGAGPQLLEKELLVLENKPEITGASRKGVKSNIRWEFRRMNDRMRFLKYQGGQFFRPHCDGPYTEQRDDERIFRTQFTVHLYLNDSKAEAENPDEVELVGGATSFLSRDEKRKMDVDPKAGRVLIFQHRDLYHSGDDVVQGTKYTMRTDIIYEMIRL